MISNQEFRDFSILTDGDIETIFALVAEAKSKK